MVTQEAPAPHLPATPPPDAMQPKTKAATAPPPPPPAQRSPNNGSALSDARDARAKQVLKEAVDAVVNSFAKHTQGYGRGE